MTDDSAQLFDLARQGNLEAIAALMSRPLRKEGISVQTNRHGDSGLTVGFMGVLAPDRDRMISFTRRALDRLELGRMEKCVRVEGWALGKMAADWSEAIDLEGKPVNPPGEAAARRRPSAIVAESTAAGVGGVDPKADELAEPMFAPEPAAAPAAPAPDPGNRMNFVELQRAIGQVVDTAIQPQTLGRLSLEDPLRPLSDRDLAAAGDPEAVQTTLDRAFELIEASIAQVQSRNLPVPNVAVGTRIDLGSIRLDIHLDVPITGNPRLVKMDLQEDEPPAADPTLPDPGVVGTAPGAAAAPAAPTDSPAAIADAPASTAAPAADPTDSNPLNQARTLLAAGRADAAIAVLNDLVSRDPSCAPAYELLCDGFERQGKRAEGLLSLKIGRNLFRQQGNDAAATAIDTRFAKEGCDPDGPAFHSVLGVVLYNQGDADGAVDELQQAIAGVPDNPEPYKILGGILGRLGKLEEAKAHLRRAQTLYLKCGNMDAARDIDNFLLRSAAPPASAPSADTLTGSASSPATIADVPHP